MSCDLPCCVEERPCPICGDPVENPRRDGQPSAPALMCEACNAGDRCDKCGDPEPGGEPLADSENTMCSFCVEAEQRADREAARREFDRREAALDDDYSRRKDERGLEMLREARR